MPRFPPLPGAPRLPISLLPLVLLSLLLVGCGGDGAVSQATPTPTPTAEQILAKASQRLTETEAVHFDLDVEGETFVDANRTIQLLAAKGDLARPDRVSTEFTARALRAATVTIKLITIGERSWTTNLLTGAWGPAQTEFQYDPGVLFDDQEGIGPVMNRAGDVRQLEDEEINERQTYHVEARVGEEVIGPVTAYTMTGAPVRVNLWIDRETGDLLRARLAQEPGEGQASPATWTLNLSGHGERVSIEPPV